MYTGSTPFKQKIPEAMRQTACDAHILSGLNGRFIHIYISAQKQPKDR